MNQLALLGGTPAIREKFAPYNSYGKEEVEAAKKVVESGVLSRYLGTWSEDFYGGDKVKEFEKEWQQFFKVNHAVAVNSATSGLIAAVGALDIEPGDEIIVSPWTMCATATAILVWNAIPVFADIEPETYNLDIKQIEKKISPRTKAILVTDIFGHAAALDEIISLAKKHSLKVIEDAAQSPGALYKGKYVGTVADIGVYSLNYHKHIHTGEGGVCVTADAKLAERMQLIRNHAEAVVKGKGVENINNMIGFNFRLGEVESAMGIEQLKKLPRLAGERTRAGSKLSEGLGELPGLTVPVVKKDCTHVYYVYSMILDTDKLKLSRDRIVEALEAEGVQGLSKGYVNVHTLPIYQKRIAYGKNGFPWKMNGAESPITYEPGICLVAEKLHTKTQFSMGLCTYDYNDSQVKQVIEAFRKVWGQLEKLR